MFVVFLRFAENKAKASELMDDHNAWIKRGFDDEVFLLVGSLQPGQGGAIVAQASSLEDLDSRGNEDPFVEHGVVTAEIHEISPARADPRLEFLLT